MVGFVKFVEIYFTERRKLEFVRNVNENTTLDYNNSYNFLISVFFIQNDE